MMEMRTDGVVEVVAVGNAFVSAIGAVLVSLRVVGALMRRRAARRIRCADGEPMLVDVIAVQVM
jgi:hypothetical protein